MAFNQRNLDCELDSARISWWSYGTDDEPSEVLVPGYFDKQNGMYTRDRLDIVVVFPNSSGKVRMTVSGEMYKADNIWLFLPTRVPTWYDAVSVEGNRALVEILLNGEPK